MMPRPAIFISAVSSELKSARQLVANTLHFLGYEGVWQDVFGTEQGDLREMLRRKIDDCAGVIQLVGQRYGYEPPEPDVQFGRVSYTQYEALYAHQHGKPVWYLFLDAGFSTTGEAEPEEKRQLQQAYHARIKTEGQLRHTIASNEALEAMVLKLRDDLSHLRRRGKQWAALVIALLVLLVVGVGWLRFELEKQKQQLALVSAQNAKLLEAMRGLSQTIAQNAQAGQKEDEATRQARAYATLEEKLKLDKGTLEKELPKFATQLLTRADTSALDRANALFATRQYADAEKAALEARDKALTAGQPVSDVINALELAGQSAEAQIQYATALDHYRAAAVLTSQERDAVEWARIQADMAYLLYENGQYQEAETAYRGVLTVYQTTRGPEDPTTLAMRNNLAIVLASQGRAADAETEFRAVLTVEERVLGPEHSDTLKTRNNLANALRSESKFADAETEYRAVLAIEQRVLGPENPQTLRSEMGLGDTLNYSGNAAGAEHEYRAVLPSQQRVLGPEHPDTLHSRMGLADTQTYQDKAADAETEYRAVLAIQQRVLGPENPETLTCRMGLAIALVFQGKFADAEVELRAVLSSRERVLGPEHPDTLMTVYNLALTLAKDKQYPEALALAKRAEAGYLKSAGAESDNAKNATNLRQGLEAEGK